MGRYEGNNPPFRISNESRDYASNSSCHIESNYGFRHHPPRSQSEGDRIHYDPAYAIPNSGHCRDFDGDRTHNGSNNSPHSHSWNTSIVSSSNYDLTYCKKVRSILPNIEPPTYIGRSDTKSPFDFIEKLCRYRDILRLSDSIILHTIIPYALHGKAYSWYDFENSVDPFKDFADFVGRFRKDFQPVDYYQSLKRDLRSRTQGLDETLYNYIIALIGYYKRLGKCLNADKLRDRVCRGINPTYVPFYRNIACVRSIRELMEQAAEVDIIVARTKAYNPPPTTCSVEPSLAYKPRKPLPSIPNYNKRTLIHNTAMHKEVHRDTRRDWSYKSDQSSTYDYPNPHVSQEPIGYEQQHCHTRREWSCESDQTSTNDYPYSNVGSDNDETYTKDYPCSHVSSDRDQISSNDYPFSHVRFARDQHEYESSCVSATTNDDAVNYESQCEELEDTLVIGQTFVLEDIHTYIQTTQPLGLDSEGLHIQNDISPSVLSLHLEPLLTPYSRSHTIIPQQAYEAQAPSTSHSSTDDMEDYASELGSLFEPMIFDEVPKPSLERTESLVYPEFVSDQVSENEFQIKAERPLTDIIVCLEMSCDQGNEMKSDCFKGNLLHTLIKAFSNQFKLVILLTILAQIAIFGYPGQRAVSYHLHSPSSSKLVSTAPLLMPFDNG